MYKFAFFLLLICCVTRVVAEPTADYFKPVASPQYGGQLRIGMHVKPISYHPLLAQNNSAAIINGLVFESLVKWNETGEVIPSLAKEWTVSPDGTSISFELRSGLIFHDGHPVTSKDVVKSYAIIQSFIRQFSDEYPFNTQFFDSHLHNIESVTAESAIRCVFKLKEPSVNFLVNLTLGFLVLPSHLWDSTITDMTQYSLIGTGPFVYESEIQNRITLRVFTPYYLKRAYLDTITLHLYSNVTDEWEALMRNEIDLVSFLPDDKYQLIKKDPAFSAITVEAPLYYALIFNLDDPLLSKKSIRQAILYAINKPDIIDRLFRGLGEVSTGPFSKNSWAYNSTITPMEYSPQIAIQLLEQEGFHFTDGKLVDPQNKPLRFQIVLNNFDQIKRDIVLLMRQHLQEIGVGLDITYCTDFNAINREHLSSQNYQLWFKACRITTNPYLIINYLLADSYLAYSNVLKPLLAQVSHSYAPKTHQTLFYKIHGMLYNEQLLGSLFSKPVFFCIRKNINYSSSFFTSFMPVYDIKNWYKTNNPQTKGGV